jgi:hypothetical protein
VDFGITKVWIFAECPSGCELGAVSQKGRKMMMSSRSEPLRGLGMALLLLLTLASCVSIVHGFHGVPHRHLSLVKASLPKSSSLKSTRANLNALGSVAAAVASPASATDRQFTSYVVYKGKAAMSVKLLGPTWENVANKGQTVAREGGMYLEFAPAAGGPRSYDWNKKQTFLMSATECGGLLAGFNEGIEFLHDPNAQGPQAGLITKRLKWAPMQDKKGLFVTLAVTSKQAAGPSSIGTAAAGAGSAMLSVPVSWGEFVVIENVMKYAIPKFLGFDTVWKQAPSLFDAPAPPPAPYDVDQANNM